MHSNSVVGYVVGLKLSAFPPEPEVVFHDVPRHRSLNRATGRNGNSKVKALLAMAPRTKKELEVKKELERAIRFQPQRWEKIKKMFGV
jgi:hypothetical protein